MLNTAVLMPPGLSSWLNKICRSRRWRAESGYASGVITSVVSGFSSGIGGRPGSTGDLRSRYHVEGANSSIGVNPRRTRPGDTSANRGRSASAAYPDFNRSSRSSCSPGTPRGTSAVSRRDLVQYRSTKPAYLVGNSIDSKGCST